MYTAVEKCGQMSSCDGVKTTCGTVYDGGCVEAEYVYHSAAGCIAPSK